MKYRPYKKKDGKWGVKTRILYVWVPVPMKVFDRKIDAENFSWLNQ